MLKRAHRGEEGFALVTAVVILMVMSLFMVVALSAGNSAFNISEKGSRFTRTLGPTEAGVNDAITRLGVNRDSTSPCPIGTALVCTGGGGEYQVSWSGTKSETMITSIGYLPSMAEADVTRKVEVTMEPEPKFQYALFSADTLEVKNNQVIMGDIFANSAVTIGTGAIICGSVLNAAGGVDVQAGAQILKSYGSTCSGKDGDVWAGGKINLGTITSTVEGDATASAPSTVSCPPTPNTDYAITGGTVNGTATACGVVTATTPSAVPNTRTDPPAQGSLPEYTFDIGNYPGFTCFALDAVGCDYDPTNFSPTAVSQFNSSVSTANMSGTYIIWQENPSQSTLVDLEDMTLSGDLTIVTNAPITLGNTGEITTTSAATLVLVSLYVPPTGTTCSTNGGDCSIFGKNSVVFDSGDPADPDDGIAGLLYTPGKMAFKNQSNGADGALYAGSMDIKNGFDIVYNERVERIVGFGTGLEQTLWQELAI
ncbi:MAG TPA: hypothetical protein VJN50_07485 [Actinomycetota bacterium]|nr:hypothetical protein [Actinomycetota bacterium]